MGIFNRNKDGEAVRETVTPGPSKPGTPTNAASPTGTAAPGTASIGAPTTAIIESLRQQLKERDALLSRAEEALRLVAALNIDGYLVDMVGNKFFMRDAVQCRKIADLIEKQLQNSKETKNASE